MYPPHHRPLLQPPAGWTVLASLSQLYRRCRPLMGLPSCLKGLSEQPSLRVAPACAPTPG